MLYFTRWKALAIILTALVVCLCAVPNFFPESTVKKWPAWAQRRLVLGLDLQGGSYLLLEVDSNYVKKEKLDQIRDDARRTLRDARISYTGLASRPDSVEVRVKDTDLQNALAKLRDLSQPLGGLLGSNGQRSLEVSDAGGGLIRLTVPPAAITERIRLGTTVLILDARPDQMRLPAANGPPTGRRSVRRVVDERLVEGALNDLAGLFVRNFGAGDPT